jgi:hypothetical protein
MRALRPRDVVFFVPFGAYLMASLSLLALGLASAIAVDPGVRDMLLGWSRAGGALGPIWRTTANAARVVESVPQIVLDYGLSLLNIGCGLFLVWKRPGDWVARLLAIAMVGSAMAYNYQAHGIVAIAAGNPQNGGVPDASRVVNIPHWIMHAVSGVAWVHALLIFPNGRVVPRRAVWLLVALYVLTIEEIVMPLIAGPIVGPDRNYPAGFIPSVITAIYRIRVIVDFEGLINTETVFFVLFFGLLIPIVGIWAQLYRYRRAASSVERAQTRIVVWALTVSFSVALISAALGAISIFATGVAFSGASSFLLEQIVLRITPPLFGVLPVAILIAVFRYRLFEIEVALDRTMIYAPLTALLALAFLGILFVLQQILQALIGQPSELALALAAFANIWLFQPMRRRVQRFIDARFVRPAGADDAPRATAPGRAG